MDKIKNQKMFIKVADRLRKTVGKLVTDNGHMTDCNGIDHWLCCDCGAAGIVRSINAYDKWRRK